MLLSLESRRMVEVVEDEVVHVVVDVEEITRKSLLINCISEFQIFVFKFIQNHVL